MNDCITSISAFFTPSLFLLGNVLSNITSFFQIHLYDLQNCIHFPYFSNLFYIYLTCYAHTSHISHIFHVYIIIFSHFLKECYKATTQTTSHVFILYSTKDTITIYNTLNMNIRIEVCDNTNM